jgi:hypothetical protein
MRFVHAVALLSWLIASPAFATPSERGRACELRNKSEVTLTGIARDVKAGAEEPNESLNTTFMLETSGPPCGKQKILVFAPGIIACISGDKVSVRGIYYAPDRVISWPMIDMAKVSCGG